MTTGNDLTARVERALADIRLGRVVVLVGDEADTDGYLVVAGQTATAAAIDFVVRHSSGFLCAPLSEEIGTRVVLPEMVGADRLVSRVDYTVAVDAATGIGTGISASDRATTLRLLANPDSTPESFTRPGHVVPIRAREAGVLTRPHFAEATLDLMRASGLLHVGGAAALVSPTDPTSIAGLEESRRFADYHGLNWVSIDDIVGYRRRTELHVHQSFRAMRSSRQGPVVAVGFHSDVTGADYVAYSPAESPSFSLRVHAFFETELAPHAPTSGQSSDARIAQALDVPNCMVLVARRGHDADSVDRCGVPDSPGYRGRIADIAEILGQFGVEESQIVDPPPGLRETLSSTASPDSSQLASDTPQDVAHSPK